MPCEELHDDLLSKTVTNASFVRLPVVLHIRRITPQEVVQQAVVGYIGRSRDLSNIIHMRQAWRQPTVNAENLLRNNSCNGECVECIHESLPDFDIASPFAFIVEAVYTCNVGAFVVAAEEEEVLGELELVAEQE